MQVNGGNLERATFTDFAMHFVTFGLKVKIFSISEIFSIFLMKYFPQDVLRQLSASRQGRWLALLCCLSLLHRLDGPHHQVGPHWSTSFNTVLSLYESFIVMLRQLFYAIKNQHFLPFAVSLWHKGVR